MENNITSKKERISIIEIMPQYPKHSRHNIYAKIKISPLEIVGLHP
jgi:hypothetical protein